MTNQPQDSCSAQRNLRLSLSAGCCVFLAAVAGTTWYSTLDSNSYLDIARFVSRGNWSAAINPFWGLSYAWILGSFFRLIGLEPLQEIAAIRLVNILMLLLTVAAFDFLLGSLLSHMRERNANTSSLLNERAVCVAGYSVLLWSCFCLNWPSRISPDVLVTAVFFMASGLLLRIQLKQKVLRNSALFGLTLVAGYYTKAVYVPLGLVFLGCLVLVLFRAKRLWPSLPLALLLLVVGGTPYYRAVARQTMGVPNAASLNYAWHVNDLWYLAHWQGEGQNVGKPIHPTRQITQGLRAYSFAEPIHATYAPWYDPSYWYAGFRTSFIPANQIRTLRETVPATLREVGGKPLIWMEGACLFVLLVGNNASLRRSSNALVALWPMVIPSFAGCAIYLAVHMEVRYIQAMVCCLMLAALASLCVPDTHSYRRSPKFTSAMISRAVAALLLTTALLSIAIRARHVVNYVSLANPLQRNREWMLAQRLKALNVPHGSRAAVIGDGIDCLWAFLGDMRIVAELPQDYGDVRHPGDADAFWLATPGKQREVLSAFRSAGADFAIADPKMSVKPPSDWIPIEGTGYYYHPLKTKD